MAVDRLELERPRQVPFSETARMVLTFAEEEARRSFVPYIGSEHIVLGLARPLPSTVEGQDPQLSQAGQLLEEGGVTLHRARAQVEFFMGKGNGWEKQPEQIDFTNDARDVIREATAIAQKAGKNEVTEMDLLRAVVSWRAATSSAIIDSLAVSETRQEGSTIIQSHRGVKLPE